MGKITKLLTSPKLFLLPAPKIAWKNYLFSWSPTAILSLLVLLLLLQLFWPINSLHQALLSVQRWPQLPSSHFYLARVLWQNGNESLAQKELAIGDQQTQSLKKILVGWIFQFDENRTKNLVGEKQRLENELEATNRQLTTYPYSWQLLLKKSLVSYQLYQDQASQKALDLASWLTPENQEVSKIKSVIENGK